VNIGVVPETCSGGGSYQYSLTVLETISRLSAGGNEDKFVYFLEAADECTRSLCPRPARVELLDIPLRSRRLKDALKQMSFLRIPIQIYRAKCTPDSRFGRTDPNRISYCRARHARLRAFAVDMMIYAYPTRKAFETGIPFIMPVHDLQHRLQPHFPEVSAGGEWDKREYLFRNAARHATTILVDSEVGKEDILNFYGAYIEPERIAVVPYCPFQNVRLEFTAEGETERVSRTYKLPPRYLFYPAQFWPHKNHERIVEALALLKESKLADVHIVFCGSHSGEIREHTFSSVMTTAARRGVASQVTNLGYAPDRDMPALYAGAEGLVMPTFFGPTNIPVLEAWTLGCPVLTSAIRGIREQAGAAALLVDPSSVEAIADGILTLWTDGALRRRLIELGRSRVKQFTPEEFTRRFHLMLEQARQRAQAKESYFAK
jgi:glycosyltransferase involved in cell wall biosynthesis